MFRVILGQVWRDSRWMLLFLAGCAVVLTQGAVQGAEAGRAAPYQAILLQVQLWGLMMPVLAFLAPLLVAIIAWWPDRQGRWTYAFTLPVDRARYAMLRAGAGGVLLAGLALVFWGAVGVAGARAVVPEGLHVYANALALRFALALLVSYALWTLLTLTGRAAAWMIVGVLVIGIGFQLFQIPLLQWLFQGLTGTWSPLHILGGRWMLLDV